VREQWERKCGVWGELACKRRVSLSLSRSLPRLGRDGRVGRCAGLATVSRRALWLAGSSHRKDALAAAGEADAARVAPSHDGGRGAARRAGRPCRRPWPPGPSRAGRSSRRPRERGRHSGCAARLHAQVAAERAAGWAGARLRARGGGSPAHVHFVTRRLGRCACVCRAGLPAGALGGLGLFVNQVGPASPSPASCRARVRA